MTVTELTKRLVNIPSVTGDEHKVADFIVEYFRPLDFEIMEQVVDAGRRNVLVKSGSIPRVILCTHMDTVPPFIPATENEVHIFGRGSCDAKGILAAMIVAAENLEMEGVSHFGILAVVGEETDSIGAKMANSLDVSSDFIIVGEPTGNKLGRGHKGLLSFKLVAEGRSAHSSLPDLSESAIHKLLDTLSDIRAMSFEEHPRLGQTTLNVGRVDGGVAHNVIAGEASAEISIRCTQSSGPILERVGEVVDGRARIEILTRAEPQELYTVPDLEQVVLAFCTDIPHLTRFGKALLIGPGSIVDAHTLDEKIEKKQLVESVETYQNLVKKLLSGGVIN